MSIMRTMSRLISYTAASRPTELTQEADDVGMWPRRGGEGIMRNLLEAASLVGGVGRSASAGGRVEPTPFFPV